jgi:hypothetical protein
MTKMNSRRIVIWHAAICFAFGAAAGPARAGLDFSLPLIPQVVVPAPAPGGTPEPDLAEKTDPPGVRIAPGLSLSPDLGSSSPYAIVDPTNPRQPVEPLLRLQVPIPP